MERSNKLFSTSRGAATLALSLLLASLGATAGDAAHTLPLEETDMIPAPVFRSAAELKIPPTRSLPDTNVNVSNLAGNEAEVSIDVNPTDPDNLVIVGHSGATPATGTYYETINTFHSMDGGRNWTLVALGATDEDGIESDFRFDPTLAFDDDGNLYVGYGARSMDDSGNTVRTVVVAKSTDGGQTYSFISLDTNPDTAGLPGNDKWHLATGPDPSDPLKQNVYIAWTQNIPEDGSTDQRIVISRSTDGGSIWSAPLIINDRSISGISPGNLFADPAVGPGGEVYVSWFNLNTGKIWVDISRDGGLTFGTDSLVHQGAAIFKKRIPAQPDRGVFIGSTIDTDRSGGPYNGRLYAAYVDYGDGGHPNTDLYLSYSDDSGNTWSPPIQVNDDTGRKSQFLPWLDVDQVTGLVTLVWYDARNDADNQQVELFLAFSDDGGSNFGTNIVVSDGQSDQSSNNRSRWRDNFLEYVGVVAHDCVATPVWADNSVDLADLDYYSDRVLITRADTPLCNQSPVSPVCNAGGPYLAQCGAEFILDGSASNNPDGGPLAFRWRGRFTPSPISGMRPTVRFLSPTRLGTVRLKVNDGITSEKCTADVTVEDTTPPIATGKLVPINLDDDDDRHFLVAFSCSDLCDPNVKAKGRLKAGSKRIRVEPGQLVEFERDDAFEIERKGEVLEIEARSLKLVVKCKDASGSKSKAISKAPARGNDDDS